MKFFLRTFLLTLLVGASAASAQPATRVEVFKSPYCGCCGEWVKHMQAAGFVVETRDVNDVPAIRKQLGMPERYGSCHTAKVGGYLVEGHVPAADVRRLLAEKPRALGLAVPAMPPGSPGMESAHPVPFDTLLVKKDGSTSVFAKHGAAKVESKMSSGTVKKIDPATDRITIAHGPLENLGMPPMTMVFKVQDKAMLSGVKPGDEIRFTAIDADGTFIVTAIERSK